MCAQQHSASPMHQSVQAKSSSHVLAAQTLGPATVEQLVSPLLAQSSLPPPVQQQRIQKDAEDSDTERDQEGVGREERHHGRQEQILQRQEQSEGLSDTPPIDTLPTATSNNCGVGEAFLRLDECKGQPHAFASLQSRKTQSRSQLPTTEHANLGQDDVITSVRDENEHDHQNTTHGAG